MANSAKHAAKNTENARSHRRVRVSLYGVMRIPEVGITRINTINISETGILITVLDKPAPLPGESVHLQLDGIVSNENTEHKIYTMNVVRQHSENTIAVAFG